MKIPHALTNQKCTICGSSFESKGKLKNHTSNVYENKCIKCEATFDATKEFEGSYESSSMRNVQFVVDVLGPKAS